MLTGKPAAHLPLGFANARRVAGDDFGHDDILPASMKTLKDNVECFLAVAGVRHKLIHPTAAERRNGAELFFCKEMRIFRGGSGDYRPLPERSRRRARLTRDASKFQGQMFLNKYPSNTSSLCWKALNRFLAHVSVP